MVLSASVTISRPLVPASLLMPSRTSSLTGFSDLITSTLNVSVGGTVSAGTCLTTTEVTGFLLHSFSRAAAFSAVTAFPANSAATKASLNPSFLTVARALFASASFLNMPA